jgi:actin-related protein
MTSAIASAVRPGLRDNRTTSSPHTPTRFASIGSNFSSPGSTFRQEEDAIIIELGSRYLRAGFEGESGPRCVIPFDKENNRRVGDYRAYAPDYRQKKSTFEEWAKDNELWRTDLRDLDLGLVEDKLERAIRELYNKYLLVDAGTARLVLVLPSILAHPLLERVLTLLFDRWNYSTITLLPSPTMSAVSGGLRSGLVIDIGWEETVATSLYEYRELSERRSARGMKMLVKESAEAMQVFAAGKLGVEKGADVGHHFVEEVVMRTAHCKSYSKGPDELLSEQTKALSIIEEDPPEDDSQDDTATIELDWPVGTSSEQIHLPLSIVNNCVDSTLFKPASGRNPLDDHEQTLPELVYKALLSLPPDVRGVCMSRIMFVGGGSHILGLSAKVLQDVQTLVSKHGWTSVRGRQIPAQRTKAPLAELSQGRTEPDIARHNVPLAIEEKDSVSHMILKETAKYAHPPQITGVLREVELLGAWAGASLATSLKIKGFVEIERDRFLSHGLAGANRDAEVSVIPQRMSSFGISGAKNSGTAGWTLGQWA